MKIHRRWRVLDCRQSPEAEVYDLALICNKGQWSFNRLVLANRNVCVHTSAAATKPMALDIVNYDGAVIAHVIQLVPQNNKPEMSQLAVESFAEEHVEFLEHNMCFVKELQAE